MCTSSSSRVRRPSRLYRGAQHSHAHPPAAPAPKKKAVEKAKERSKRQRPPTPSRPRGRFHKMLPCGDDGLVQRVTRTAGKDQARKSNLFIGSRTATRGWPLRALTWEVKRTCAQSALPRAQIKRLHFRFRVGGVGGAAVDPKWPPPAPPPATGGRQRPHLQSRKPFVKGKRHSPAT